jgi:uncharacterized protein YjbI with pentapeptide repeats
MTEFRTPEGAPVQSGGVGAPEKQLDELRQRRDDGETLPGAVAPLSLSGLRLLRADLAGLDLSGWDFSGAELSGANLEGSRMASANFEGAILHGARLDGAEFMGANAKGADFSSVSGERTGFGQVALRGASFFQAALPGATFSGSDLQECDFRVANMDGARALGADFRSADCSGASFQDADLTSILVDKACFINVDLRRSRLRGVKDYKGADWVGADIRDVDFSGAWLLRRHVLDENYIAEFREQSRTHELLYRLWWLSSDCGRSISRWTLWSISVALIFAGLYGFVDIDYGDHETWFSPIYYSVVTFTTLGYGDVLPASTAAQMVALVEVVLGYLALGGLLAILADKLARRAG